MKMHSRTLFSRYGAWLLLILLISSLVSCAPAPSSIIKLPLSTIRVVMDNNYPPYVFTDDQGQVQGILVDQWKLWEERTGVKVNLTALPWSEALQRMQAGEFDVIDTIFYTDERAQVFDFTPAYAPIAVPIFFQKNISGIADAGNLKGFRVAVKAGDANADYLVNQGLTDLVYYNSYEEIVQAAARSEETIFVVDQPPGLYFLYKYGIQDQFNYSAPLYSGEFHRAITKGNPALLNLVTTGFSAISAADYRAIDRRWLGTGGSADWQPVMPYVLAGLVVVLLIILVLVVFSRTLQQRVRQRTRELEETAEALHDSRRFLADLIEFGGTLIFVKDRDGRYELVNRKFEEVTGLKREAVIGKTDAVLFPGPIGMQFRTNDLEVLETGTVLEREEFLEDARGRRYFISIKFPVRSDDGHIKGACGMTTEITERKRAEEALAESEEIFRLFMEHSPIYVFFKDEQTRALRLSKNYEQMLGRPLTELLGKAMEELFPSDLASSMTTDDLRIMREGQQIDVVEELNGHVYKTTKFPIIRPGHPSWLAGYTIDITEQTRAVEALRQSEDKFSKAFHTSPDSININRLSDGLYLEINEGFTAMTGYTSEEVRGKTSLELNIWANPESRARLVQGLREHSLVSNLEASFVMKDGRVITGLMSAAVIEIAGEKCILSIARDITDRKQAEEALRESEVKFRAMIEQASEGFALVDEDARFIEWNRAQERIFGLTREEVLGRSAYDVQFQVMASERRTPEHYAYLKAVLLKALRTGEAPFFQRQIEAELQLPDGRCVTIQQSAFPIKTTQGYRLASLSLDITERKRVEDEIRRLNEDLERRVVERTRELAAANARLTELDQLKSKFVSDVSHELRTPIANLKLYIDLLERGKPDKQAQYIHVLHQQVRRVAALVDDILDLSRLERRKEQGLIYRAVALNEVIDQVVLAHQPRAEADGLSLTFEAASPLPPVRADANQLAQVVTNLVANALSYTSTGYVRVGTYAEHDQVCLSVADSGSGIAPDDLPHVFERFYRGQLVLKNDVPGTGLGLAIVKEIVDLHEGRIEVDSQPEHGTIFRVWLPVASTI